MKDKIFKEVIMKIKPIFLVMLVCLLTLSFVFVSCKTDDDDGGGGGATFPTELHGTWTNTDSEVITIAATTLTYEGDAGNLTGKNGNRYTIKYLGANISFDAVITSGDLVISNPSTNLFPDGTFTK
jgi:hypothetical protein